MCDHAQNPAEISPVIEQHLICVENRLNSAQMALELMTVSNHINLKSTNDLMSDCERLLDAAIELHWYMRKNDNVVTFDQALPKEDLFEDQGQVSNANHLTQQSAPEISQLGKARLENQQKLKREFSKLKTKDWIQLLIIKSQKAYKGLQVEIGGQQTTIKTFEDYCLYAVGLSYKSVSETLQFIEEFGPDLFTALNSVRAGFRYMRKVRKLSADQKQALLRVAQTGDKAATLAFIDQALQAGE